ncbi:MAG TPA: hypothetical protein VMP08_04230 [Anaerolineae bacterium]|nr:hypothetical protein [Anaerolineae bacterium]
MKRCGLLIIVAIALAACTGATPSPNTPPVSPVMTPAVSPLETPVLSPLATPVTSPELSATPTATASDRAATFPNTIIVVQREGGIAGTSDKWTIYPTGRIVSGDGTEWQVPAEQVAPLFKLVEAPGFANLNTQYPTAIPCADCYVYTLTVYGQGEPQTVTLGEGADLPARVQQILDEINKAIAH